MTHPYVITVSSEKGGVGKTTVATNLAIFLKALAEDLPVTLLSFDNHFSVDAMFRIGNRPGGGHVGDLFTGRAAESLVETGEFGVQFIPSSRDLNDWKTRITSPLALAEALAESHLEGVLIIDTRPDLDIFTRNAISSADRVIIPVKDTPSLENCRHLFEFAERQGIPRQRLKVLPCLVDFRIQYDGPFKNPHQLMRAYAINRGYRCFDECISKSPKVESLNTNPEGKIFPILTYGRGTDVHQQFAVLAREMLQDMASTSPRRLADVARTLSEGRRARQDDYLRRLNGLVTTCPLCGERLVGEEGVLQGAAFYLENSTGRFSAFAHEPCVGDMLTSRFLARAGGGNELSEELQTLLRETFRRCYFVLRRAPGTRNYVTPQISLYRFDEGGLETSHQTIPLAPVEGHDDGLPRLLTAALATECPDEEPFLLLRRVSRDFPDGILMPENRTTFEQISRRIADQFPRA